MAIKKPHQRPRHSASFAHDFGDVRLLQGAALGQLVENAAQSAGQVVEHVSSRPFVRGAEQTPIAPVRETRGMAVPLGA